MKIITQLLLLFIIGCTDSKSKSDNQILDFGSFKIETPGSWTKVKVKGIDSYVGQIAIDTKDTLYFDLGWYSNTLSEPLIVDSRTGIDPDKYRKNQVLSDTIDGRRAKIIFPIQSGYGTTGIYIDSLLKAGSVNDKFNLFGTNLNPANEKVLLQALKTLKFHKPK